MQKLNAIAFYFPAAGGEIDKLMPEQRTMMQQNKDLYILYGIHIRRRVSDRIASSTPPPTASALSETV
jgi:hypothetical protein